MGVVGRSYRCRILTFYVIILDKKIVEVYEAAVKNYPTNEEFLTQLFMAYVRVGDCVKQQQVGERERETDRKRGNIYLFVYSFNHSLVHLVYCRLLFSYQSIIHRVAPIIVGE